MKKIIIVILVLIVIIIGFYFIYNKNNSYSIHNKQINTQDISKGSTVQSGNVIVDIKNFAFNPQILNIKSGTNVSWINNDSVPHTITSDSENILNSPTLAPGESFNFTFTNSGTINYHCNIHRTMNGTIIVE